MANESVVEKVEARMTQTTADLTGAALVAEFKSGTAMLHFLPMGDGDTVPESEIFTWQGVRYRLLKP